MNISSKSWHYKAACITSYNCPSNNLCGYFREVMAGMLLMTFGAIVVAGVCFVLLTPFLMWGWPQLASAGCGVGSLITMITAVYLIQKLFKTITKATGKVCDKIAEATFVEVTSEWISAKKKSICPRIDFK